MTRERFIVIVGAVIATLLQVFLAPHVVIGFAFSNFMLAFCLVVSLVRPNDSGPLFSFVIGLVFDLLSGAPVGAMALSLLVISTVGSFVFRRSQNDTTFMVVIALAACVFLTDFVYGLIILLFGYSASFFDALVYRVLPCFLYDFVLALCFYFIVLRAFGNSDSTSLRTEIKQL